MSALRAFPQNGDECHIQAVNQGGICCAGFLRVQEDGGEEVWVRGIEGVGFDVGVLKGGGDEVGNVG